MEAADRPGTLDLLKETCRDAVTELDAAAALFSRVIGDLLLVVTGAALPVRSTPNPLITHLCSRQAAFHLSGSPAPGVATIGAFTRLEAARP